MGVALGASVAEAKAYLRIDDAGDDALLARLIGTATEVCEAFVGAALIRRTVTETMPAPLWWRRLATRPVVAVTGVAEVTAAGPVALAAGAYAIDIAEGGDALLRVTAPGVRRIAVTYQAGLADGAEALPAAIGQGILRLVAHLHAHRDAADDRGPPAAVAALWRPYRRMRL